MAYLGKISAPCVGRYAGTHTRIIIRIMLVFFFCISMGNGKSQTKGQNPRLFCIKYSLECITYQLLLVMVLLSVRK